MYGYFTPAVAEAAMSICLIVLEPNLGNLDDGVFPLVVDELTNSCHANGQFDSRE